MKFDRLRVASIQYYIRPVKTFQQFEDQVEALLMTAADYKCKLAVFPEYFTIQLLTLGNVKRPICEQVRDLANQAPRFVEFMSAQAKQSGLFIAAGTIPVQTNGNQINNVCYFFNPDGEYGSQAKMHMTRFEIEEWEVSSLPPLRVFETDIGKIAICVCYDVEFPELARVAAREGAMILLVPSCTDDRQGFLRVRYCAHARAIENQMFVIQSSTVGSLPMVPAVSLNYGQSAILTPSDFSFARDGILAEANVNQEMMVIGDLNLKMIEESRFSGTVLPLRDSARTDEVAKAMEFVKL